jgi:hypothetical protein
VSFTVSRIMRDRVFRRIVLRAYDQRCAITGLKLINGGGRAEVAAAHIRPVEASGPDIVNNGIALSGTAHWMFDRGLISLSDDLEILVFSTGERLGCRAGIYQPVWICIYSFAKFRTTTSALLALASAALLQTVNQVWVGCCAVFCRSGTEDIRGEPPCHWLPGSDYNALLWIMVSCGTSCVAASRKILASPFARHGIADSCNVHACLTV